LSKSLRFVSIWLLALKFFLKYRYLLDPPKDQKNRLGIHQVSRMSRDFELHEMHGNRSAGLHLAMYRVPHSQTQEDIHRAHRYRHHLQWSHRQLHQEQIVLDSLPELINLEDAVRSKAYKRHC
jgi:hypothetical protein